MSNPRLRARHLRFPHSIIGPRQKYDDPFRNVASIMMNLMLQGRQPMIYGNGEQKRCFSFVQDVIDVLAKMAFDPGVVGEVINVGPDEEFVSINELAKIVAELMGFQTRSHLRRSATAGSDACQFVGRQGPLTFGLPN